MHESLFAWSLSLSENSFSKRVNQNLCSRKFRGFDHLNYLLHFNSIYLVLRVLQLLHQNTELVKARSNLKALGFSFVKRSFLEIGSLSVSNHSLYLLWHLPFLLSHILWQVLDLLNSLSLLLAN